MDYCIAELLGEYHKKAFKALKNGEFVNLYLSPKDYHRYHFPDRLKVKSVTHIPAKLYPVNFPLLRNKKNLFIENERVVVECRDENKRTFVMVLVGALNVGKMVLLFEDKDKKPIAILERAQTISIRLWLIRGSCWVV